MFTNLIESDSHRKEFKRRGSFFLVTVAGYAFVLFAAGVAGVLTYEAHVDAQNTDLQLDYWVPPVKPIIPNDPPKVSFGSRRPRPSTAPVDPNVTKPMRLAAIESATSPTKIPDTVGTMKSDIPPATGAVDIGPKNVDPPFVPSTAPGNCTNCPDTTTPAAAETTTPPAKPAEEKPRTQTVSSRVLTSKIVSLPKPDYPSLARQMRAQGPVNVQILIDESGKVISAHAVSGNATLTKAAEQAAYRARFTPTMLNNQPVKVQGVITYNFLLQ